MAYVVPSIPIRRNVGRVGAGGESALSEGSGIFPTGCEGRDDSSFLLGRPARSAAESDFGVGDEADSVRSCGSTAGATGGSSGCVDLSCH